METIGHIRGLEKTTPRFRWELVQLAKRLGLAPEHLAAVMSLETGGTFDPAIRNAQSGATGLLQWLPSTARRMGTTTDALAKMSARQQLKYVERFYAPQAGKLRRAHQAYLWVFYPKATFWPMDAAIAVKGEPEYDQNAGLDADNDGEITVSDTATKMDEIISAAGGRDRIVVTKPAEHRRGGGSVGRVVFVFALGGLVTLAWTKRDKVRGLLTSPGTEGTTDG